MDVLVAGTADHQGLASPFGHELYPSGFLPLARPVEVGELADVMDLQLLGCSAQLAAPGHEPVDQLVSLGGGQNGSAVCQQRRLLPL